MATTLGTIRTRVRRKLIETTASFWTDDELLEHMIEGAKDLWGALIDLHQEHFFTVDITNVSMAASSSTLTGVPADVFKVLLIEPRDISSTASGRNAMFVPRDYNSVEFTRARATPAQDPGGGPTIYFAVSGAGAPVGAPTIHVAPQLTSALTLRLAYAPVLGTLTALSNNPIPGESDNALFAWTVAYARAKERDDRSPDPNWLAVYSTEKQNVLVRSVPRQAVENETVADVFADSWGT